MKIDFFKYEGTGNDFIIIDNRNYLIKEYNFIKKLCNRKYGIGADGVIIIEKNYNKNYNSIIYMKYFNSDGNESTMCGNGGRCLISYLNMINTNDKFIFNAIDGIHNGFIKNGIIYIRMIDILIESFSKKNINNIFVNTGSPHHVLFINHNINEIDVYNEGKKIRLNNIYKKNGVNVNFVKIINNKILEIRTYERGVENETLSCGTGVIASAISSHYLNKIKINNINVLTKGGYLNVCFDIDNKYYKNIWLSGPVNFIFKGYINL